MLLASHPDFTQGDSWKCVLKDIASRVDGGRNSANLIDPKVVAKEDLNPGSVAVIAGPGERQGSATGARPGRWLADG